MCAEVRIGAQCANCRYDFATADLHPAISALENRLGNARLITIFSLASMFVWGFIVAGLGVVAVPIAVVAVPLGVALGVLRARDTKRLLASARAQLPQLPAARVLKP